MLGEKKASFLERMIRVVSAETSHLPVCATATSIGPGKLLYITVCCLVVGAVFLLPGKGRGRGNMDGRCVVNLSRMTHTWRLFPLAVKIDKR